MKLEGKCVKVIDSDITEDTCWSKCYSYVITKNIHVLTNVKLSVQDGACLFLLNGKFDYDKNEYNGGGIIFDAGSKLCAGNLPILSVVLEDGKYVISTKINYNINNNGIKFFGTKEEESVEDVNSEVTLKQVKLKNVSKSDKVKLHRKKMNELKKNMVVDNNQPSKFVFKSLNLEYIGGLFLIDLDSKEFCGKNINTFNLFSDISPIFLNNTCICLDNLRMELDKPLMQNEVSNLSLGESTLTINKSLIVLGGSYFVQLSGFNPNETSSIILNKCSKFEIEVGAFDNKYLIDLKGKLGNINKIPYIVDKCLKEKVVITINYNDYYGYYYD